MSWPQNPNDPQQPQQPARQPPQQGFGPAPTWTPTGEMPQIPPQGPPGPPPQAPQPAPPPQAQSPHSQPTQALQGPPPPPAGFPTHATAPQNHFGSYPGQQPPAPQEPQPQPARNRKTLLTVVGAVVALAVIGGGAFALLGGGKKTQQAKASSSASAPSQTAPTPTQDGPNTTGNGSDAKPMIAGWQTQTWQRHGFSYDVPPQSENWKVAKPDLEIVYTDKNGQPMVGMTGTSDYREGGCASAGNQSGPIAAGKGQLATIGSQGAKGGTLQDDAKIAAGNWGFAAYGGADGHKPKVSVSTPTPWKHNGIDGYTATATVTGIYQPSPCVPATATARSIAMRLKDGTIGLWIIYADQGVPNALTSAEIDKIMGTVRPAGAS
ncbi:hypothetical protein [Streptantibioticus ferralitis]|uniref:DUF8017 domain-containing protein n=1 Tax=Streptantibioticus ferralitis TaxID=236510 RepID=A0ABT5ZCI1_9ACTN|nr:hypothetical protein [Streptantibioticus ferralitis]MDF2260745.1 hypothetical protein [Streptantibioticus ferralitis]